MSNATKNAIVVALQSLVLAAANAATGSAALTAAACEAIAIGAHVNDVIEAVQCGYQENGQDLPQGMASNLRRLAAAPAKLVRTIGASGYALNNKLLSHFEVPTLSTKGAPKKTAKPAPMVQPAATEKRGPITEALVQARDAMAMCLTWKENDRGLSTAQVDEVKEHYAAIAAILGQCVKSK